MKRTLMASVCILALSAPARAGSRIKDITDLEGARSNQLYGFGLVVGLGGTGGASRFTQQVAVDMMKRLCVNSKIVMQVQTDNVFQSKSISAVMVTAEIGPFSRIGSRLDITVSVLDDASSLQGGTLLFTPLKGADDVVYAIGQGPLSVGGFAFGGAAASAQKNYVSVGASPAEDSWSTKLRGEVLCRGRVHLLLKNPDYSTSRSVAAVINEWAPGRALPLDAGTIEVDVPLEFRAHVVAFLSDLGNLEVLIDAPGASSSTNARERSWPVRMSKSPPSPSRTAISPSSRARRRRCRSPTPSARAKPSWCRARRLASRSRPPPCTSLRNRSQSPIWPAPSTRSACRRAI